MLLLHPSLVGTFAGGAVSLLGLPFRVLGRGIYSHASSVLVAPVAESASAVAITPHFGAVAVLAEEALEVDAIVALHASGVDDVILLTNVQLVRARLSALLRLVARRGGSASSDLPVSPTIEVNGRPVEMPRLCRRVYRLFERSAGHPVTIEEILGAMDTPGASVNNAVQMVARLRVCLGPEGARIRTLRKRGYVFNP